LHSTRSKKAHNPGLLHLSTNERIILYVSGTPRTPPVSGAVPKTWFGRVMKRHVKTVRSQLNTELSAPIAFSVPQLRKAEKGACRYPGVPFIQLFTQLPHLCQCLTRAADLCNATTTTSAVLVDLPQTRYLSAFGSR